MKNEIFICSNVINTIMPYCIECGLKIEETWNICPQCGKELKKQEIHQPQPLPRFQPQPTAPRVPTYQKSSSMAGQNTYGAVALVCGIVGLFCGGIVFGVIAIIIGGLGLNRDENSGMAVIGLILGVIDITCFFISWFWLFSWFSFPFPY
ncbi:MAG: zinc-ribbon domain-containing protein [Promethearchaeota archaeon]